MRQLRGPVHAALAPRRHRPLPVQRLRPLPQDERCQPSPRAATEAPGECGWPGWSSSITAWEPVELREGEERVGQDHSTWSTATGPLHWGPLPHRVCRVSPKGLGCPELDTEPPGPGSLCAGWGLSHVTLGTLGCQVVGWWRGKMTWPPDGTGGKSGCWMLALWADSDSYRGRTLTTAPDTAGMGPDQVCGCSLGKTHFRFCVSLLYGWLARRGLGARVLPAAGQSLQKPCKGFKLLCSLPFHRQTLMVK